ncbi:hypothetical protein ACFVYC_10955 [Pseudarthrobacter sp. NPDC058329]|uniref:hypothetical protein n=1 Tax=Pseudarthrobacter sp. NPDC058329 TaxID=3346448 RepID=UPI0036DD9622
MIRMLLERHGERLGFDGHGGMGRASVVYVALQRSRVQDRVDADFGPNQRPVLATGVEQAPQTIPDSMPAKNTQATPTVVAGPESG